MSLFARLKSLFQRPQAAAAAPKSLILCEIERIKPGKILEMGMGDGRRARAMIEAAARHRPMADVHYVGIDCFEARTDSQPSLITLRDAHRTLRASGAKIQLLPGEPLETLVRWANALGKIDMLVFSAGIDPASLPRVWFYLPRLLTEQSQVYLERLLEDGSTTLQSVPRAEIDARAAAAIPLRKAA